MNMLSRKLLRISTIIIISLITIMIGQYIVLGFFASKEITYNEKFITSSFVNLDQISSISYFRSCEGHDFPGYNNEGEYERGRSMKHYLNPSHELEQSTGRIMAFAPFDGVVETVAPEGIGDSIFSGRGKAVYIKHNSSNWYFQFFHIDPVSEIVEGAQVKSGQLIGHANLKDAGNFDVGLYNGVDNSVFTFLVTEIVGYDYPPFFMQNDSPFKYFDDSVRKYFESYTIPVDEMEISKEFRDENTCDFNKYDTEKNYYRWGIQEYLNNGK